MQQYLQATYFFDYEDDNVQRLIADLKIADLSDQEKAIASYLMVRDGWRYNAYKLYFAKEKWRASEVARQKEAHCIDKSVLLVAVLRGLGIPARIHFAKVKNHIAVDKLVEKFGTNELSPHGIANVFLNGKWVKASPAFNAELCEKCNVAPLDFDGENDSVFQEYDREGNTFMEYLEDYGHFEDLPFDFIMNNIQENYPGFSHLIIGD
ncbi:MAG: transglutaminase-like putative cysteine protease [Saprospiraceae bacterium]|jgi:transglutaminase-like putative cysteine protease